MSCIGQAEFESLRGMFSSKINIPIVNGKDLVFHERHENSKIKNLHITNVPGNQLFLAITLDFDGISDRCKTCKINNVCKRKGCEFEQLSLYLNKESENINKSCDIACVWFDDCGLCVLLCDMKSTKVDKSASIQLQNSKLFMQYVFTMFKSYCFTELDYDSIKFYKSIVSVEAPISKKRSVFGADCNRYVNIISVSPSGSKEGYIDFDKLVKYPCNWE